MYLGGANTWLEVGGARRRAAVDCTLMEGGVVEAVQGSCPIVACQSCLKAALIDSHRMGGFNSNNTFNFNNTMLAYSASWCSFQCYREGLWEHPVPISTSELASTHIKLHTCKACVHKLTISLWCSPPYSFTSRQPSLFPTPMKYHCKIDIVMHWDKRTLVITDFTITAWPWQPWNVILSPIPITKVCYCIGFWNLISNVLACSVHPTLLTSSMHWYHGHIGWPC